MHFPSIPVTAGLLALALAGTSVSARSLRMQAQVLHAPQLELRGVEVVARLGDDGGELRITAQRLHAGAVGLDGTLDWHCALRREGETWDCAGPLRMGGAGEAELALQMDARQFRLSLRREPVRVTVEWPLGPGPLDLQVTRLPAHWIEPALAVAWPQAILRAGTLDARLQVDHDGRIAGNAKAAGLGLSLQDGTLAFDGVDVDGTLDVHAGAGPVQILADLELANGSLRVGDLHVHLPAAGAQLGLDISRAADETWQFSRLAWHDPQALSFSASGSFEPSAVAPLRSLRIDGLHGVFPLARQRYLDRLLVTRGLDALRLTGALDGAVEVDGRGLSRLALSTSRLEVRDDARGIRVSGLHGGIDWRREGSGTPQALGWTKARVAATPIEQLRSRWQVRDGAMHLLGTLDARLLGGTLKASKLMLAMPRAHAPWLRGDFQLRGLAYDAPDGSLGFAGIGADVDLQLAGDPAQPHVDAQASLLGGQYLFGSAYVQLPATPIQARLDARLTPDLWRIDALRWNDPGILQAQLSGQWLPASGKFAELQATLDRVELAPAVDRYARTWLAARGYPQLSARGRVLGSLGIVAGRAHDFSLAVEGVDIADGNGRFKLDGLAGRLDWSAAQSRSPSVFGWQHLEFYEVPFGAAQAHLASDTDSLHLSAPLVVDVLGGQLSLEKFSAQPASPRGDRYAASFAIRGVQLPQLSAAFGWPTFPGNLSGGIPEIEFAGDRIDFNGGLDLYLFDGHLGVNSMSMERPFGTAPALGANIHFENFDLQQLTSAFSFGSMSGRLFGTINDLRTLDWSPVAFDAWLRTSGDGTMSYNAVDDITGIGSGAPPLQNLALKLVDTFGFARLGLRCRLRDEVCTMGGIQPLPESVAATDSPAGRGYAIVEGAGVPRIDIIGHRRRVDWPTLVRRLHEATQGQAPVIQ